jgi:HlyD family secretion protein
MARIITKRRVFWLLALIGFAGAIWAGSLKLHSYWRKTTAERFRTAAVRHGDIKFEVKSTGTVKPVLSVQVGSYVSGPIQKVCVDFNDKVKKDQLLAEIDPQVYKAQRLQAKAALARSVADLEQYKAKLNQTGREFKRAEDLYNISDIPGVDHTIRGIADSDYDLAKANFEMATANVEVATAIVEQNKAALDMAETNLSYTEIRSPVDGMVIDRKVDAGQTLASQFQTPVMFVVAPDLEKEVYILASVDEADIGLVRKAEESRQPVHFTVDAYPDDKFEGKIKQIRLSPKEELNVTVVTYTTVVEAPNPELKLLPGMTANLTFQIEKHENVLKIPNAALRFHPQPEYVHPKHRALLEGLKKEKDSDKKASDEAADGDNPADEEKESAKNPDSNQDAQADAEKKPDKGIKKQVWYLDGDLLSPLEIKVGISDSRYSELVSGDLKEGRKLVTGIKTAAEIAAAKTSQQ